MTQVQIVVQEQDVDRFAIIFLVKKEKKRRKKEREKGEERCKEMRNRTLH